MFESVYWGIVSWFTGPRSANFLRIKKLIGHRGEAQAQSFGTTLTFVVDEFYKRNNMSLISPAKWIEFAGISEYPKRALKAVADIVCAHAVYPRKSDKEPKQYGPEMVACVLCRQPAPCFKCLLAALRDIIAGLPRETHEALAGNVSRDVLSECAADVLVLVYHLAPSPQEATQFMDSEESDMVQIRVGDAEQRFLETLSF